MAKKNILIVDNDKDMCRILSEILEEEGYSVKVAHNGKAAVSNIKKEEYDLIVLDYKLFGISGLTVLEKAYQIRPSIRTIMISAFGDNSVKARAKELGAYYFLDKPFDIGRFVQIVKNTLANPVRNKTPEASVLPSAKISNGANPVRNPTMAHRYSKISNGANPVIETTRGSSGH